MTIFTLLSFAAHLGPMEADLKLVGQGILAEFNGGSSKRYGCDRDLPTIGLNLSPKLLLRDGDRPLLHNSKWGQFKLTRM
jgi:hypothetical protein